MDLKGLAELTGQKSISDMTNEELMEHLRVIRGQRLVTRGSEVKVREQKPKALKGLPSTAAIGEDALDDLMNLLGD